MSIETRARELLLDNDPGAIAAWRAADPANEAALREAQRVWTALGRTSYARDGRWRLDAARRTPRWAAPAAVAASLAVAAVIAPQFLARPDQSVRTATAQTGTVSLPGGEHIYVGARSRVEVRARTATLKDGEAFFDASNGPLTVQAKGAVIRATGAKFNVRCTPDGLEIAVLEGRVQVLTRTWPLAAPTPAADLTGGQQLRMQGAEVATAAPLTTDPEGWRKGRLLYADAPLREVVADANRYSNRPIRLASRDIGDLRVTVSFRTGAVDELIRNLDAGLPVKAAREADGDIVLESESAPN
ncbi:MAG: FecR family protein [Ignavibacteriales bacterium]